MVDNIEEREETHKRQSEQEQQKNRFLIVVESCVLVVGEKITGSEMERRQFDFDFELR